AIHHDLIPPTINFSEPNPALDLDNTPFVIAKQAEAWNKPVEQRLAGVSSFGIGGTNAHVIVKGVVAPVASTDENLSVDQLPNWLPLCISAKSAAALDSYLNSYRDYLQTNPAVNVASLANYLLAH